MTDEGHYGGSKLRDVILRTSKSVFRDEILGGLFNLE
jgi:hypothetical protein